MSIGKVLWSTLIIPFLISISVDGAVIHESLQAQLDRLTADQTVEAIAFFKHQADIASLNQKLKEKRATLAERNRRIIAELQEAATQTQPLMIAYLETLMARGTVKSYRMFWIANIFHVEATREGFEALAGRQDLDILYANIPIELIEPVEHDSGGDLLLGHEIGLERINALAAWEHGWTGEGSIVMNIDTGVDGTHPALSERFLGDVDGDGDYDESWIDPYDTNWDFPEDGGSHGTHTMGTICGRSASGDTIGVAIDAQWIAAAAVDRGGGMQRTIDDILVSFEWAVDPDGDPLTQDNPDVIGNSWGIPDGYDWEDCDTTFWVVIDNVEAAGSVVIFSAGNEGHNGLRSPPDRTETIYNVFSVGAVDGNDPDLPIADWSARGPSECSFDPLLNIKPEVVAPGVNVRSSVPGGGYATMSGTSMASPHITGAVAVIRQANPNLDVDTIKDILMSTAHDLPFDNPNGEDNTFGHGIIDLYEACLLAQAGHGFVEGQVTDIYDNGLGNAMIRVVDSEISTYTGEDGYYDMILPGDMTYTLEASLFGYLPEQIEIDLAVQETLVVDFVLQVASPGDLHGTIVSAEDASPIAGASVEVVGAPIEPTQSDDNGYYEFTALPGDITYMIRAKASGFGIGEDSILVPGGGEAELNFALDMFESFENDDANWVGEGVWEWGEPTSGPNSAFDGLNVWATALNGNYADDADDLLISNFIAVDEGQAILKFQHWYDFEQEAPPRDGGNISISILGEDTWELITPEGGYPDDQIRGLDDEPGYSGSSDDWVEAELDLGSFEGSIIQLGFRVGTDRTNTRAGWYIDSVDASGAVLLPFPDIEADPVSFAVELQPGQSIDRTLAIVNPSDGVLTFEITPIVVYGRLRNNGNSTPPGVLSAGNAYEEGNYQYDGNRDFPAVTTGPGHDIQGPDRDPQMILDWGGPDGFGYTWIDSDEPDGPIYEWIDISEDGQPLQFYNDENEGPFDLGFEIPFYGDYYGSIYICSNGWISFTSTATSHFNQPIPNEPEPNNLVAPFWDDLNPSNGGMVYFYTNGNDSAIVAWEGVPHYPDIGSYTFEVILTADGDITCQYDNLEGTLSSCTIGIEDSDGTIGLQVAYNQNYITENLAVNIIHPNVWLSADPLSGFVMPGSSSDINVAFDATELDEGEYVGYLEIVSNDPDQSSIAVQCTLTVGQTGIDDLSGIVPERFELQQNYPNPFNATTRISFALPVQSDVRLTVYDLLGRQVKELSAGKLPAGYHAITWSGTDDRGRPVSSGVYFYSLKAGDFRQSCKMIMLK